ncbi:MAG: hypothetical protein CFE26_08160 [Verrucomicrobiales bacterium VVV1]|nr:MAG: hypothetical protein CFE26_08160 [Verrucomicrobiales bacterium VVV1]
MNLLRTLARCVPRRGGFAACIFWILLGASASANRINWFSTLNRTNLTSSGQPMDSQFRFELGVFINGFTPTSANTSQWAANWRSPQRTRYNPNPGVRQFNEEFIVEDNDAPYTVGAAAYLWGFRGNAASGEWILIRNITWTWPAPNPFNPTPPSWNAADAATPVSGVVILGSVHASGSPHLMQSAAVTNSAPPTTSWAVWQADELEGVTLNGPNDDADGDGISNLIEFAFGTTPKTANTPVATPASILELSGQRYLQITVPRRVDHAATLVIEVSPDLGNWYSGTSHTQVVSNTLTSLVVRDLTPLSSTATKRFMRVRAIPPTP